MFAACLSWVPGCKGAQVEEIWSMDPENFDNLKYVRIATELYCIAKICFFKCVYSATGQFMGWFFSSNGSQVRSLQGPSSKIQGLTTSSLLNRYFQPLYIKYVCEQYLLTCKSATNKCVAVCCFIHGFRVLFSQSSSFDGLTYGLQLKFSQISKQNSKFLSFYFRSSVYVFIIYAFNFQSMAWYVSLHRALRTLLPVCFLSSVLCVFCHSQVINNACATQAIVSVLLNCSHSDMLLGDTLTEFREFSQSFDAAVRSRYISESWTASRFEWFIYLDSCWAARSQLNVSVRQ